MTGIFGRPRSAKDRAIAEGLVPLLDDMVERGLAALTALVATTSSVSGECRCPRGAGPPAISRPKCQRTRGGSRVEMEDRDQAPEAPAG